MSLLIDLIGHKYRNWTPTEYLGSQNWLCKCDCGHLQKLHRVSLRGKFPDRCKKCDELELQGKRFGRWTVLKIVNRKRSCGDYVIWKCRCDCGALGEIPGARLKRGESKCCRACINIKWGHAASFNKLYSAYMRDAKKRGIEWNLSKEQFMYLTKLDCYYTGLPPSSIKKTTGGHYIYNGIDRVDNKRGYEMSNCVPCNKVVNKMKLNLDCDRFLEMCALITKTMASKDIKSFLKAV